MVNKNEWSQNLKTIEKKTEEFGYTVMYLKYGGPRVNRVDFVLKKIFIYAGQNDEIKSYILLHELGHVLQRQKEDEYEEYYFDIIEGFTPDSFTWQCVDVENELDAWKRGFYLAKDLGIEINRRKFEIYKTQSVKSYILYAVSVL